MTHFPPFGAWSLKTKLALCCGALMFACLGAFTSWTLHAVQADLIGAVTDAQKALARSTADDIDEKIESRTDAVVRTADALSASGIGFDSTAGFDAFFKSQPVTRSLFDGMVVVDTSGRFLFDTDSASGRVGQTMLERPYSKQVLAGAPSAMSSPFRASRGDNPLLVVFGAPLRHADGRVAGAVFGSINLARPNFLGRLAGAHIGKAGRFTLIEKGPHPFIVMHNDARRILSPVDPASDPNLARALAGFEGTLQGVAGGIEALRTSASLRNAPWVLVAVYPTAEAFAAMRERQREILWIASAACLLASVAAWLMAGWLLRPLARLRRELDRHGSGPDRAMAPASFGSAEVSTLVAAYNAQTTRRLEVEGRLKTSERRMRDIADALPVLISHVDRDERHLFLNATFKGWLGIDPAAAIGHTLAELMPADLCATRREELQRCLAGERVEFEHEVDAVGGRKTLHSVYIPDLGADAAVQGVYALATDVTDLKEAQRQLALLVRRDALTGLPNRYQFDETLPLALARSRRSGFGMALMFLDIDHFKQINDGFGHAVGDAVLKEFAQRLARSVRATDMAARLGGDEFVVVLEGLHGDAEPQAVARKIMREIKRPFDVDGRLLVVTASVGVAFQPAGEASADRVFAMADTALYEAKAAGRNNYRMAAPN